MENTAPKNPSAVNAAKTGALHARWGLLDTLLLLLVSGSVFLLYRYGLGALEFFRHTEADRTLIGWEMVERGEYVVPRLLGSEILTKPPIFYWLIALSISLFGEVSELIARVPSLLFAVLLASAQFYFCRQITGSRTFALLSSLMLGTTGLFMVLGTSAEIDMTFASLSAISLYALYVSMERRSFLITLLAYAVAGLAFLTKGPQIVAFFALSSLGFFLWQRLRDENPPAFLRYLVHNLFGISVFCFVVSTWLYFLSVEVGWEQLAYQFKVEVLDRALVRSERARGPLFYLQSLASGLLPWTIFLVVGLIALIRHKGVTPSWFERERRDSFLLFNVLTLLLGTLLLSFAEGKSNRYLFPLYPFAINIVTYFTLSLRNTQEERALYKSGLLLGAGSIIAMIVFTIINPFEGVPLSNWLQTAAVFIPVVALCTWFCFKEDRVRVVTTLFIVLFAVRIVYVEIYIEHRNHTRSVKEIASEIDEIVPTKEPIYTIEMFERWIVFYLKRSGRDVYRLTPELAEGLAKEPGKVFLLLSGEEEPWRIRNLTHYAPETKTLSSPSNGRDHVIVASTPTNALASLNLKSSFPTVPTTPYPIPRDFAPK